MAKESIFGQYKFLREWQYIWVEYFAHLQSISIPEKIIIPDQAHLLDDIYKSNYIQKTSFKKVWSFLKSIPQKFLGKLNWRNKPKPITIIYGDPKSEEEYEQNIFDFIQKDFNEIYHSENYKGSVLGMIALEFQRQGFDLNRLKKMSLNDIDQELKERGFKGLNDIDDFLEKTNFHNSRYYAKLYAETEGARWLAVYNQNGERSGRAYEIITQMYREAITEALEKNISIDDVRQALMYANENSIKEDFIKNGQLDENAYQEFITRHLSRDMIRFAVTETSYAFNNGKILYALHNNLKYIIFAKI